MSGFGRARLVLCVAGALCLHASARQGQRTTLCLSNVLKALTQYKARRPGLTAAALAPRTTTT